MHPFEEHESELSDYFCSWIYVALGLLVFENVFCFVCNREDTIQYHGGLRSRELGQAPMLLVFLTPRQVLSSHPLQQMVWLYWLQDRDSIPNWYTINHPTTLHTHNETQWPTAARRWHFALWGVSRRQSCHLLTPSHLTVGKLSVDAGSLCSEIWQPSWDRPQAILKCQPPICLDYRAHNRPHIFALECT